MHRIIFSNVRGIIPYPTNLFDKTRRVGSTMLILHVSIEENFWYCLYDYFEKPERAETSLNAKFRLI